MLEDIFRAHPNGGGSLLLSIDWPGGAAQGRSPKDPCENCERLICEAVKCMDIQICDENNRKQDARDRCEDQTPAKGSQGGPKKGRKPS